MSEFRLKSSASHYRRLEGLALIPSIMPSDTRHHAINSQAAAVLGNLENQPSLSITLRIEIEEVVEHAFEIAYRCKPESAQILQFPRARAIVRKAALRE